MSHSGYLPTWSTIMDKSTKAFLSRYPELQYDKETQKVKCTLSGHEMPCRLEVLQSYVGGKKFLTLKSHKDFNFQRLEPLIVPSARRKHQLFCAITNRYINRKRDEVKSHLNGKRYKSALEQYNAGRIELFKERVRKPKQDEDSISTGDQAKVENEHMTEESSANLNGNDSEETDNEDNSDDDTKNAFWVSDGSQSGIGCEEDDSELRTLDPEEFCTGEEDQSEKEDQEPVEERSVEVSAQGDRVETKRVNRKRKAKLALLQSMKRTKVPKTSLKTNSRQSKKPY